MLYQLSYRPDLERNLSGLMSKGKHNLSKNITKLPTQQIFPLEAQNGAKPRANMSLHLQVDCNCRRFRFWSKAQVGSRNEHSKESLRIALKAKLAEIAIHKRDEAAFLAAEAFMDEVFNLEMFKTVALFSSFGREISTLPLLKKLESRKVKVVYPKISKVTKALEFYQGCPVVRGSLGVDEPDPRLSQKVECSGIELFVVPGLGFSKVGGRLGRGGGFYDRTLSKSLGAVKVGFCFEEQLVGHVPMLKEDVFMDWVVTPHRAYRAQSAEAF